MFHVNITDNSKTGPPTNTKFSKACKTQGSLIRGQQLTIIWQKLNEMSKYKIILMEMRQQLL